MNNELSPYQSVSDLRANRDFWEDTAKREGERADYYQEQLAKAHELLGRVVHQNSERWDQVNLTSHFPTDNKWRRRSTMNPKGDNQ